MMAGMQTSSDRSHPSWTLQDSSEVPPSGSGDGRPALATAAPVCAGAGFSECLRDGSGENMEWVFGGHTALFINVKATNIERQKLVNN